MAARLAVEPNGPVRAPTVLQPGTNCWRRDRSPRFRCIQDGAEYFSSVRRALLDAKETVFILGWDIAPKLDLLPDRPKSDPPSTFARLLAWIATRRPSLQIFVLIWNYGSVFALERDPFARIRLTIGMPRNVRFAFDGDHPVGGSHHQKVVVIDDSLAFSGGIDLTTHRWDTPQHRVVNPHRVSKGTAYTPYHEVQAMVNGEAAAALGELARERWRRYGLKDKDLPPVAAPVADQWLSGVEPDLLGTDVAISRTYIPTDDQPPIRECEALFIDSIAAAREAVYIESQYFTCQQIGRALESRLQERDGPEIVVVTPQDSSGWLERTTVGVFRNEVCRRLRAADRHGRLRIVHPLASREQAVATFVHSKVMVVDDTFLRVGSANCSNRSMGVDSECDLALEATGADAASVRAGILHVRAKLLAEHLGQKVDTVTAGLEGGMTMRALIDRYAGAERCLEPLEIPADDPAIGEALRPLADPIEPVEPRDVVRAIRRWWSRWFG